jgi:hypothetical protein
LVDLTDGCLARATSPRVERQHACLISCLVYDDPWLHSMRAPRMRPPEIVDSYPELVVVLKIDPRGEWSREGMPRPAELFPPEDQVFRALASGRAPFLIEYA